MKTVLTIAPPPPARRHRPLSVEPLVFAMLLLALTLSINMGLPGTDAAQDAAEKRQTAQPAEQTRQTDSAEPARAAQPAHVAQMH
ncbi:MAG: hypothetical protein Q8K96_09755 [Rubrivivax sp.]|nr:hypothetical protein [Rubrivivax sp.]